MGENKKEVKARKKAFRKAKHRAIRPWKGLSIVCAILAVIFVPLYSLLNVFDNSLAIFVGGTFWKLKNEDQSAQYFTSDFESTEDMVDYGLQLVQQQEHLEPEQVELSQMLRLPSQQQLQITFSLCV